MLKLLRQGDGNYKYVCSLSGWTLNIDAASIDVTPIGTQWAEAIKDLVTAGGEMNWIMDIKEDTFIDPQDLLDLLLEVQSPQAEAEAQFYISNADNRYTCFAPVDIYLSMKILLVRTNINVAVAESIRGASTFVSTEALQIVQS